MRGAKLGVPHITKRVLAMSENQRNAWLDEKCGTPEIKQEIQNRLTEIMANGGREYNGKMHRDYSKMFAGRSYTELIGAMDCLNAAINSSKAAEAKRLDDIIANADAEKKRLITELVKQ